MRRVVPLAVAVLGLAVVGGAGADGTPLNGSVGPGFAISLKDAGNLRVTHLDPGAYSLTVTDVADSHNFHLQGPGAIDVSTPVDTTATQTFSVNLVDGTYQFFCDAHPTTMKGSFTVGAAQAPPPTPPPAPTPPTPKPKPVALTLTATSTAVTLKRAGASAVRRLAPGIYTIRAIDRSATQSAHLIGAGINKKTGIAFVGAVTWKVTLKTGTLVYRSDATKPKLRAGKVTVAAV